MACHSCWEPPKPVVPGEAAGGGLVTLGAQCRLCTLSAAGPGAYRVSACWEAAGGAVGTCGLPSGPAASSREAGTRTVLPVPHFLHLSQTFFVPAGN